MNLFDVYPVFDIEIVKAKDVYVYDENGKEYLDLYGGHGVISIGHSHPDYIQAIQNQLNKVGFYSNSIQLPLQKKLAALLGKVSGCEDYQLFMCNSGAEANENALKLASFHTGKKRVLAFENSFHGRTSAAVSVTDNESIQASLNKQHKVTFIPKNDVEALEKELSKEDVCAVIFETIQGVGGLDQLSSEFLVSLESLATKYKVCLIADEIQSGYGRSKHFFAFQKSGITPHIISTAKGMGNGFPIGGICVHPSISPKWGMLGTTFGGNYLACVAALSVLEVMQKEQLISKMEKLESYFRERAKGISAIKLVKGSGMMLGVELDFEVATLRKKLLIEKRIFTGSSANKKLIRILPPLTIQEKHLEYFFSSLNELLPS